MLSSRLPSDFIPGLGSNDHFNVFVQILMNVTVIPVKIRAPAQTRSTVTAAPVQMDLKAQIVRQVGLIHSGLNKMTEIQHPFVFKCMKSTGKMSTIYGHICFHTEIHKWVTCANDKNAVTLEAESFKMINYMIYVFSELKELYHCINKLHCCLKSVSAAKECLQRTW